MEAATTGNVSMLFGDLRYYTIAERSGRVMQRLNELYAANGQVGFRMFERVDGKVTLSAAIKKMTQA
jgi:HK97 family phage major capsid protein